MGAPYGGSYYPFVNSNPISFSMFVVPENGFPESVPSIRFPVSAQMEPCGESNRTPRRGNRGNPRRPLWGPHGGPLGSLGAPLGHKLGCPSCDIPWRINKNIYVFVGFCLICLRFFCVEFVCDFGENKCGFGSPARRFGVRGLAGAIIFLNFLVFAAPLVAGFLYCDWISA